MPNIKEATHKRRLHGSATYPGPKFRTVDDYLASKREPVTRIFDLGEVRDIGSKCGLSSEEVRGALRRLGFELVERKSGVKEWKKIRNDVSVAGATEQSSSNGED